MDTLENWIKKINAKKIENNVFYIGEQDIQINECCVICAVDSITIDDNVVLFKQNNGYLTATFLINSINRIELN